MHARINNLIVQSATHAPTAVALTDQSRSTAAGIPNQLSRTPASYSAFDAPYTHNAPGARRDQLTAEEHITTASSHAVSVCDVPVVAGAWMRISYPIPYCTLRISCQA